MENQHIENNPSQISFDEYTKEKIWGAAKTAGIVALLSISGAAVGLISYFINPNSVTKMAAKEGFDEKALQLQGSANFLSIATSLILNLVLFYFLYRFYSLTKKAIFNNNSIQLSNGFSSLATYFKVVVILIIMFIGILLVTVIATALGFGVAMK